MMFLYARQGENLQLSSVSASGEGMTHERRHKISKIKNQHKGLKTYF